MSLALKLDKFRALNSGRRRLLFRAWFALGRARWLLLRKPFRELVAGFEKCGAEGSLPGIEPGTLGRARDIGWAVRAASSYTPWKSACLVQVLAAQRMLQEREIGGEFFIGAAREEGQGEPGFQAHAWLTCGDTFITGEAGHEKFTVVSGFRWG